MTTELKKKRTRKSPEKHSKTSQFSWDFLDPNSAPEISADPVRLPALSGSASALAPASESSAVSAPDVKPIAEPKVISVRDINRKVRDLIEGEFSLIWVKGEISNFKAHTSGHFYFSLKDSSAQISAVMFRGFNSQLRFRPEEGMEVIVRGKITVYEPQGKYQIFCELMEPVGAGALQKAFEQLKARLSAEGLFAPEKKRPLPEFPRHIAIVTSPTGAAIQDMMNVLARRNPGVRLTVIPCRVQGTTSAKEIVAALEMAQRLPDVDLVIAGRGGGSIEDLWSFNDEAVARAIANCRVPIVSAVGHEVDFTIADFVADVRAPTPSAAAELAVKNVGDIISQIQSLARSLQASVLKSVQHSQALMRSLERRLVDPRRRLQDLAIRSDDLGQRLELATLRYIDERRAYLALQNSKMGTPLELVARRRQRVISSAGRLQMALKVYINLRREKVTSKIAVLDSLSPLKVLARGFAVVRVEGQVVREAGSLKLGALANIQLESGSFNAKVCEIKN
jgi:exodeoxyribonuclease VII large subunit